MATKALPTLPDVCRAFNKDGCDDDGCQHLHICFYFITGRCKYNNKCIKTHLLTTVHNTVVLKAHGWHHDNQHPKILKQLMERFKPSMSRADELKPPGICFAYNTIGCPNLNCTHLHLCLNYIQGKCSKGGSCSMEHSITHGEHNLQVLKTAKCLDVEAAIVFEKLRLTYLSMSNQAAKTWNPPSDTPVAGKDADSMAVLKVCYAYNKNGCKNLSCHHLHMCLDFVRSPCTRKGCPLEHNIFKGEHNMDIIRQHQLQHTDAKGVLLRMREWYQAKEAGAKSAETTPKCGDGASAAPSGSTERSTQPRNLVCIVCQELFIKATTLGCSHTFCEGCVQRVIRQTDTCPLCRAAIATTVRSLVIDDAVEDWVDGLDVEAQQARRRLVAQRRRDGVGLLETPQLPPVGSGKSADSGGPAGRGGPASRGRPASRGGPASRGVGGRSKSRGPASGKTVTTTVVTYH